MTMERPSERAAFLFARFLRAIALSAIGGLLLEFFLMCIFKIKKFARFAKKAGISDADLVEAARRAERGLIDADLGGGVIKQRIARRGEGRSGGFRTIILIKRGKLAFFVFGFAKKDADNLPDHHLDYAKAFAKAVFKFDAAQLKQMVDTGNATEVFYDVEGT